MLDGERGRHRQECNADEAKSSQRRGLGRSRPFSSPALRRMNAGRCDQDVGREPRRVRPGLGARGSAERRDVVDEVGDEHEDERGGRQPDHGGAALTVEEQGRQQAEQEDVSRGVRDACERRPAPALVQRRLEYDRPEHEQRGQRDDRDIDEVTPVDLAAARPEQQSQTNSEQRVAGDVQHIGRRRVRVPTRHLDRAPHDVSDRPAHLTCRDQQPGQPGGCRRQRRAHRECRRCEHRDRDVEGPTDRRVVPHQHVDGNRRGTENEHRPVAGAGVQKAGRSLTESPCSKTAHLS